MPECISHTKDKYCTKIYVFVCEFLVQEDDQKKFKNHYILVTYQHTRPLFFESHGIVKKF